MICYKIQTLPILRCKLYDNETQMIDWMCDSSIANVRIDTCTHDLFCHLFFRMHHQYLVNACSLFTYITRDENITAVWDELTSRPNYHAQDVCHLFNCNLRLSIYSRCFRVTSSSLRLSYSVTGSNWTKLWLKWMPNPLEYNIIKDVRATFHIEIFQAYNGIIILNGTNRIYHDIWSK